MVIGSHLATIMVPHRTQFLLLAAVLIPTIVCAADFTGKVVGIIDGDTLDVLHNHKLNSSASTASTVLRRGSIHQFPSAPPCGLILPLLE
jgi:endonuclease YncB( thermonuclease family)